MDKPPKKTAMPRCADSPGELHRCYGRIRCSQAAEVVLWVRRFACSPYMICLSRLPRPFKDRLTWLRVVKSLEKKQWWFGKDH